MYSDVSWLKPIQIIYLNLCNIKVFFMCWIQWFSSIRQSMLNPSLAYGSLRSRIWIRISMLIQKGVQPFVNSLLDWVYACFSATCLLNPTTLKNAHTYEPELTYLVHCLKKIRTFRGCTAPGCCIEAETGLCRTKRPNPTWTQIFLQQLIQTGILDLDWSVYS